jgi:hypothetical protein
MKKSRLSPLASVLIERQTEQGTELVTEYFGSSLKGGRAFAKAIQKAQADAQARKVVYMEMVMAQAVVQASVPIIHENAETDVSPDEGEPF